ncbi:RNA recognition motif 2-domain-containing protein [Fennellomyces sp. T-0311]|nr:RNA recognition motif 2-domain-containing protein [Fennellomyces sp. T-0311]
MQPFNMDAPAAGRQTRPILGRVVATGLVPSGMFNPAVSRPKHSQYTDHHRTALGNLTNTTKERPGNMIEGRSSSDLPKFDPFGRTPLISHFDSSSSSLGSFTPSLASVHSNPETLVTRHLQVSSIRCAEDARAIQRILENSGTIRTMYPDFLYTAGTLVVTFYDLREASRALEAIKSFFSSEFNEGVQVTYISDGTLAHTYNLPLQDSRSESTVILSLHGAHDRLVVFNQKVLQTTRFPDTQYEKDFFETWGDARSIVEMEFSGIRRTIQVEFYDQRSAAHVTADLHNQVTQGITFQVCSTLRGPFASPDSNFFDSPTSLPSSTSYWSAVQDPKQQEPEQQPGYALVQMFSQDQPTTPATTPFSLFANSPPFRSESITQPTSTSTSTATSSNERQPRASTSPPLQRSRGHAEHDNTLDINRVLNETDKRTTFMIRNIPNKYTQAMLKECIDATHRGTYDFLYLRIDFQNKCNVGYAFINFIDVKSVITFAKERVGRRWNRFNSEKRCSISYANIQGKDALIEKFRNSSVMEEEESYRPKIFYSYGPRRGEEQPFPGPTISSEVRRQRQEHRSHRESA